MCVEYFPFEIYICGHNPCAPEKIMMVTSDSKKKGSFLLFLLKNMRNKQKEIREINKDKERNSIQCTKLMAGLSP